MGKQRSSWWASAMNVQALAEALVSQGFIYNCDDLLAYYARPFTYDLEWQYFVQNKTMAGFEGILESRRRE